MLALKYEFITYEFILKMSWCEERTERLTLDSADAVGSRVGPKYLGTGCCDFADFVSLCTSSGGRCAMEEWEVVHAVGEIVNASTLTKQVPEINEERSR
jgi:hypothetical protein